MNAWASTITRRFDRPRAVLRQFADGTPYASLLLSPAGDEWLSVDDRQSVHDLLKVLLEADALLEAAGLPEPGCPTPAPEAIPVTTISYHGRRRARRDRGPRVPWPNWQKWRDWLRQFAACAVAGDEPWTTAVPVTEPCPDPEPVLRVPRVCGIARHALLPDATTPDLPPVTP